MIYTFVTDNDGFMPMELESDGEAIAIARNQSFITEVYNETTKTRVYEKQ